MSDRNGKPGLIREDLVPDRALKEGDLDAFDHEAVAGRLAELVSYVETPCNVALFGEWGSGKSSIYELLRRALPTVGKRTALVHYDAWKYGGSSLKRNFISNAASQLQMPENDPGNKEFYRGLYETSRAFEFDFDVLLRSQTGRLAGVLAFALLAGGMVVAVFAILIGLLPDTTFAVSDLAQLIGTVGAPVSGVVFAGTLLLKLLDAGKVEVEQTAPSDDEQFAGTFRRLIAKVTDGQLGRPRPDRLIFFVDELDRCAPEDVVDTLTSLRTFLDQPNCVFVVVADRDVLEQALSAMPQESPTNTEDPYYSSVSGFVDKVFQYQMALPPLRIGKLTRFAHDLVIDRGGLWEDLREAQDDPQLFGAVNYALIPTHVRSPRRVKVLLNRFATNVRVAEARGLPWLKRAREIAKLTVLETEFPLFTKALVLEPRLSSLVLSPPNGKTGRPRLDRLLVQFGVIPPVDRLPEETEGAELLEPDSKRPELDRLLIEDFGEATATQHRNLIRYLRRTKWIEDPAPDLFYLSAAGAEAGIDDPGLARLLEERAPEEPEVVIEALGQRHEDEKLAAARFLATLVEADVGIEQSNSMSVLMSLARDLGPRLAPAAAPVVEALKSFVEVQELTSDSLVGGLRIARLVEKGEDAPLTKRIFADERLLEGSENVSQLAVLLGVLDETHRETIVSRVSEIYPTEPRVLEEALVELDQENVLYLLDGLSATMRETAEATENDVGYEEASGDIGMILEAIERRETDGGVRQALQWTFLHCDARAAYEAAKTLAESANLEEWSARDSNSHGLTGLLRGPESDWEFWSGWLRPPAKPWRVQRDRAVAVVHHMLESIVAGQAEVAEGVALRVAVGIQLILQEDFDEETQDALLTSAEGILAASDWWVSDHASAVRSTLFAVLTELGGANHDLAERIIRLIAEDVERVFLSEPATQSPVAWQALRRVSGQVPPEVTARIAQAFDDFDAALLSEETTIEQSRARISVAASAYSAGFQDIPRPHLAVAKSASPDGSDASLQAVGSWLRLAPPIAQASELASHLGLVGSGMNLPAFLEWATKLTREDQTSFLLEIVQQTDDATKWVEALAELDLDEDALAKQWSAKMKSLSTRGERQHYADLLIALTPDSPAAQRLIGLTIESMIRSDRKADFEVGLSAVQSLGTRHRCATRIEDALKLARKKHGWTVTKKPTRALKRAGITPQTSVFKSPSVSSFFKSLFGGDE